MAQQEKMTLTEFIKTFSTEEACREHLYQIKWKDGFVCPKCAEKGEPFNIKSHNRYQCKACNHQTTVTAGTIMDKTRTPLKKWFLAIYLMSQDKRGCSALKLKRELGIAYDTAWVMSHKIRKAMGQREQAYFLSGEVEVDEAFFGSAHVGGKRGRGTDKNAVMIAVSHDEKGKPQYLKAKLVEAVNAKTIETFANEHIEKGSLIKSDAFRAYQKFNSPEYRHLLEKFSTNTESEHLKWVHVVIGNLKTFVLGTYHGLARKHLQAYLDEFVFRFNRRMWHDQLFNRMCLACACSTKLTRYDLIR